MRHNLSYYVPWLLFGIVLIVPFLGWLNTYEWNPVFTARSLFPLLGVWAWSIMWTHYAYGYLRLTSPEVFKKNEAYSRVSAWFVLAFLLLHPLLLAWSQFQALGLFPTESYYVGVAPTLRIFVTFGLIALPIFLSYEIFMRLRGANWVKRIWGWISLTQITAMVLIFTHGISIGQTVLRGWTLGYWILLGVLLVPAFYVVGKDDWRQQQSARSEKTTP